MSIARLSPALAGLAAALALAAPASAEILSAETFCVQKGRIGDCGDRTVGMAPPAGWHADAAESARRGVQIFLPDGRSFGDAPALIYAKVRPNTSGLALDAWLANANARWKAAHPDAEILRVKDVAARAGIDRVVVERYTTPSLKNQPSELSATFAEADAQGRPHMVQVVLSGLGADAVEAAVPAFLSMIEAYAKAKP